jgi:hypothetical protein
LTNNNTVELKSLNILSVYDNDIALQLALGNLNVNDKSPVDDFNPENWKVC